MFQGTYTALFTPMNPNSRVKKEFSVDYAGFEKLLKYQINWGVDGLVVLGTTAETPQLDTREKNRLVKTAKESIAESDRDVKLIIGTGDINPYTARDNTWRAYEAGANAAMVVVPYYVKPNTAGLIKSFEMLAEIPIPIIIYNVPGRTGRGITIEEYKELVQIPNIFGVKEASGNIDHIDRVINEIKNPMIAKGREFSVLSGDDGLTFKVMQAGGDGVISVISNVVPRQVKALTDAMHAGDISKAEEINKMLAGLAELAFIDSNPVPIKYIGMRMGLIKHDCCRLPLSYMAKEKGTIANRFLVNFLSGNYSRTA